MSKAMRQMPELSGRAGVANGEAGRYPAGDEACGTSHEHQGTGSATSSAGSGTLLEAALTRENLQAAWKRVKANKGAAGVDGLDIEHTQCQLRTKWPLNRQELRAGRYRPSPVRRVLIPKSDGRQRELGIPTVTDRLIQQALLQVLQPLLDPTFSEHSYGFRPGRRAHDAVLAAQSFVQSGRRVVVDVDLEKFFDRVNHDILIDRLQKRIDDAGVIRLVRSYLNAGIMDGGVVMGREEGTPQGGPLSPLLANVLLDEVDRELERRGHCFARYADDCNVYVCSLRAGERVIELLRRLYGRLKLKINEAKSAVSHVEGRKFLGFTFWLYKEKVRCKVADKALATFKQRVRQLTWRSGGNSVQDVIEQLKRYLMGWKAYYQLAQMPDVWRGLDEWIRRRLRAIHLKHWKRGSTTFRELRALGASAEVARRVAAHARRWWWNSTGQINRVLSIAYFDGLGVPSLYLS
jgi:RNA-directed DNA polymerase